MWDGLSDICWIIGFKHYFTPGLIPCEVSRMLKNKVCRIVAQKVMEHIYFLSPILLNKNILRAEVFKYPCLWTQFQGFPLDSSEVVIFSKWSLWVMSHHNRGTVTRCDVAEETF
jgi:hypothetical protein